MPRKSRAKKQSESPAGLSAAEPVTVAEVLAESPIKALIDAQEAKSRVEPERPMPEPDGSEAVAAFERQRKREQAVKEPAAETPSKPRVKTWRETVRPWESFGRGEGVSHVTTTSPDMVGIRFSENKKRTAEEKREMEDHGLKFFNEAQAWLKTNRGNAFDETQALTERFAERRREEMTQERGR